MPKPPQQDANADRYIAIARACLKAINETASDNGTREEKIQAVYQAIDDAFKQEFADYRQSTAVMASVLEKIASGQMDAESAASLARKTLDQQPQSARSSIIH
jgi:maltose-binding protein MalE